jgi:hypothetical protein
MTLCMKMEVAFPCFPNCVTSYLIKLSFNIHQCEKLRFHACDRTLAGGNKQLGMLLVVCVIQSVAGLCFCFITVH